MPYIYSDSDNAPMNDHTEAELKRMEQDSRNKNCKLRCRYSRWCRLKGFEDDTFSDECAEYYHIDDLMMEARDIAAQERWEREHGMDEDIPFSDPPDEEDEDDGEI